MVIQCENMSGSYISQHACISYFHSPLDADLFRNSHLELTLFALKITEDCTSSKNVRFGGLAIFIFNQFY